MFAVVYSEGMTATEATKAALAQARKLVALSARGGQVLVEAVWQDSTCQRLGLAFGEPGVKYARKWPNGDDVKDSIVPPEPEQPPEQPAPQPPLDLAASPAPASGSVLPPPESSVSEAAERPTKKCPDCAETVLRDARICRFCRYEFDKPEEHPLWDDLPPR